MSLHLPGRVSFILPVAFLTLALNLPLLRAQSPAPSSRTAEVFETITGAQLLALMRGEGYAVELDEDGDIVWKIEGVRVFVLVAQDKTSLQFRAAFRDSNADLDKVNEWNKTKRYSRTYLDDEGDPILVLDFDLAGGVTTARLLDFIKTCHVSLPKWVQEVVR